MQSIARKLAISATALFTLATSMPQASATDVRLDGSGYYILGRSDKFFRSGTVQSGRYRNLGRDFYHRTEYGIDFIGNDSRNTSGTLSYELWALPFFGAQSGIILITRGIGPLRGGLEYKDVVKNGLAVSLNERRFPEQSLWEFTRKGWQFRDALSFSRKTIL